MEKNKYEIRSDEYNSLLRKVPRMFVFWGNIFVVLFLVIIALTLNLISIDNHYSMHIKIVESRGQFDSTIYVGSLSRKESLETIKRNNSTVKLNTIGHNPSTDILGTIKAVDTTKNLIFISINGVTKPNIGTFYNLKFAAPQESFFAIVQKNINKK